MSTLLHYLMGGRACRVLRRHTWGAVLDEKLEETGMEECCYCEERRATP